MNVLSGKTVLIGVSGGIAAYKTCTVVSRLVQAGACVHVMMTANATEFVTPLTFETLSRNRVTVDTFDRNFVWEVEHVSLAKKADVLLIAPATANVLGKLACGIADDFLTTTALACTCPVIVAPAMNSAMLLNPAVKRNIAALAERGYGVVYGGEGYLACGDSGCGRMAEPETLVKAVTDKLTAPCDYAKKTVLVTCGSTRADIDPVRFLGNRSSGKMGYALAYAAWARGANIVLIKGFTSERFSVPDGWTVVDVSSTPQMLSAVQKYAPTCDVAIMAAAPCDYTVTPAAQKIKDGSLTLTFEKAPDIAAWVGKNKGKTKLVIFAAETDNCLKNAKAKLTAKRADMAVLNDVTKPNAGFEADTNIVTLITADGAKELPLMTKRELADVILDRITEL